MFLILPIGTNLFPVRPHFAFNTVVNCSPPKGSKERVFPPCNSFLVLLPNLCGHFRYFPSRVAAVTLFFPRVRFSFDYPTRSKETFPRF